MYTVWPDILAGIMFCGLLEKGKIAIGGYQFSGYGTIATPSPGVYVVGAILAV